MIVAPEILKFVKKFRFFKSLNLFSVNQFIATVMQSTAGSPPIT